MSGHKCDQTGRLRGGKDKVPVFPPYLMWAKFPLTPTYSRYQLLLHGEPYRRIPEIQDWVEAFLQFLQTPRCPDFVKNDVEYAKERYETANQPQNINPQQNVHVQNEDEGEPLEFDPQIPDMDEDFAPPGEDLNPHINFLPPGDDTLLPEDAALVIHWDYGNVSLDWSANRNNYPDNGSTFLESRMANLQAADIDIEYEKCDNLDLFMLNLNQKNIFHVVLSHIMAGENGVFLRIILNGKGGAGKSFLIKAIVNTVQRFIDTRLAAHVGAPTGTAAHLINGSTLHTLLSLPIRGSVQARVGAMPQGSKGERLQDCFAPTQLIVFDEYSMIGKNTFGQCSQAAKNLMKRGNFSTSSLGGVSVAMLCGDVMQLPPTLDTPLYDPATSVNKVANNGRLEFGNFRTVYFLEKCMRLNPNELRLKETVENLRKNKATSQDAKFLQELQYEKVVAKYGQEKVDDHLKDGLYVAPTRVKVAQYNNQKLQELNRLNPVAKILAKNTGRCASKVDSNKCPLQNKLLICKGAKVRLTCNLIVSEGLYNGSIGYVRDIIYGTPKAEGFPLYVLVDIFNYKSDTTFCDEPKLVPIAKVKRPMDCKCKYPCSREQIPLALAYGMTCHAVQGSTVGRNQVFKCLLLDPGDKKFESNNPGVLQMLLSRGQSSGDEEHLPDIIFAPGYFINTTRVTHVVDTRKTTNRTRELQRLHTLATETKQRFPPINEADFLKLVSRLNRHCQLSLATLNTLEERLNSLTPEDRANLE